MDSSILQKFIEEAENYLPTIRCEILLCSQEGISGGELETSLRYIQAIKEAAREASLPEVSRVAEKLEHKLGTAIRTRDALSHEQARDFLDDLAELEGLLVKESFETEEFSLNIASLIDQSLKNLGHAPAGPAAGTEEFIFELVDESEDFQIDEEMLEVFTGEAEDLLRSIHAHLKILEANPNNRESLLEIRRSAHTLKGSAGIVGLKMLSGLAHHVEDLLDFLAENEIDGSRRICELLLTSTDCFSLLATGNTSPQLTEQIMRLGEEFTATLNALKNQTARTKLAADGGANETKMPAAGPNEAGEVPGAPSQNRAVVRVSLERLDNLVKLVSDLIISRSVFEQRLQEFERQVGELQHVTGRLMHSTGKLETDFEARLLASSRELVHEKTQPAEDTPPSAAVTPESVPAVAFSASQFDPLELDRYTEFHQTTRELLEIVSDAGAINSELDLLRGSLEALYDEQSRLIEDLQHKLLNLRMVRFGTIAGRLQRTVRVTCEQEEKWAELLIEGDDVEIDTQMLDALVEPLLHLLRNAVAHGIESPDMRRLLGKDETGKIHLRLHNDGTHIVLSVSDDGRGMSVGGLKEKAIQNGFITPAEAAGMSDDEAFALAYLPGVTTAGAISQVAGRGVGMNIVRNNILRQQGGISITSEPRRGTTFTIRLPMTMAVARGLLVKAGNQTFAFPARLLKRVGEVPADAAEPALLRGALDLDGTRYRLLHLNTALGLPAASQPKRETVPLLVLDAGEDPAAFLVDEIIKTEDIVIKPLGAPLKNVGGLLGATILGDGTVVPVLDLPVWLKNGLPRSSSRFPGSPAAAEDRGTPPQDRRPLQVPAPAAEIADRQSRLQVLVVDDSPSVRQITSKLIREAGWDVRVAKDGVEALEVLDAADRLPDIILTDVEMPRLDGYQLLASLKSHERLKSVPVVMITSRGGEKHRAKAFHLGVAEYLTKPFDDLVLLEKIRSLTRRR